jgi:hypothetical protein
MPLDATSYEKLGAFYLGRPVDPAGAAPADAPLLYDAKDLVTHAVIVGMTGSGKTGLGIDLIEEAAIDGIPSLVVDPKGDLGDLLLTFPELRGEDFRPWVNEDDARRQGLSADDFAAAQADLWRHGLAKWGQDGERIARLRQAADFAIYTPGSDAGLPVSVLASFQAPPPELVADSDLLSERITTTARSLLGLVGIEADPVRSREHILLANLFEQAWRQGRDLDLGQLIQLVQAPPLDRVGVLPLESFYPAKDRFELAMTLNNLLAAPGFASWLTGEPLDVGRLLYTASGRPRVAVFSIAHLADRERMFFVSLLLDQLVGWMRTRPGTTSLRALFYMDELAGFLPPVANPPSKPPLLTLLKQARAFGVGAVLATQNPADLDYKALSNAGTWFLGRLQTERDKARVLEGLEGAAAGSAGGAPFDRGAMERTLAGLGKRTFLLHNVHEDAPVVFETRWAMSYLAGPLTRAQIARLTAERRGAAEAGVAANAASAGGQAGPAATSAPPASAAVAAAPATSPPPATPAVAPAAPATATSPTAAAAGAPRPVLPPEIDQRFVPLRGRPEVAPLYQPRLLGLARVHFVDERKGIDHLEELALLSPLPERATDVDWFDAKPLELAVDDLEAAPGDPAAAFAPLPASGSDPRSYPGWAKDLADALYRTRQLALFTCAALNEVSKPGEGEREFRIRLTESAREARDRETEALRRKYAAKMSSLEERQRRAEQRVSREREQAQQQKLQTALSFGATVLGAFLGRKRITTGTLGRASTAFRGVGRSFKEAQDVAHAEEDVTAVQQALADLESELKGETDRLAATYDPTAVTLEPLALKPRRADVDVRVVALAWAP